MIVTMVPFVSFVPLECSLQRTVSFATLGRRSAAHYTLIFQINVPAFFLVFGIFKNESEDGAAFLDRVLFLGWVGLEGAVDELEGLRGWVRREGDRHCGWSF